MTGMSGLLSTGFGANLACTVLRVHSVLLDVVQDRVMTAPPSLEAFAEAPLAWIPPEPGGDIVRLEHMVLQHSPVSSSPEFGSVLRLRLATLDQVEPALERARGWFLKRQRTRSSWHVRESKNPPGLVDALLACGLQRHAREPSGYSAMVAEEVPAMGFAHDVRRAEATQDHLVGAQILAEAFELDEDETQTLLRAVAAPERRLPHMATYLGYLDGRPAARGSVLFAPDGTGALFAGATLGWARRQGLHEALVSARLQEVKRRGGAGAAVIAGAASKRNFERLGFRVVDTLTVLVDNPTRGGD